MNYMKKIVNHTKTVHTHRTEVRKLCFKCGLYTQGITHDMSKYSPVEFFASARHWTGTSSPIEREIEEKGYSPAWLHHQSHNKHHYEYWIDPMHLEIPVRIPKKYVAEMFCDRTAAAKTYLKEDYTQSSPLEYMESRTKEKQFMNPETYQRLHDLFYILSVKGEDYACAYIKKWLTKKEY